MTGPSGFFGRRAPEPEPEPEPELASHDDSPFYVRPSNKRPDDTIVVGTTVNGRSQRIALIRLLDDGVRVRTLNGDPRERSSTADTQAVFEMDWEDLTDDE